MENKASFSYPMLDFCIHKTTTQSSETKGLFKGYHEPLTNIVLKCFFF